MKEYNLSVLNSIARRALYFSTQMISLANSRSDKQKGDPKVGGHPAASTSSLHLLGALHLVVKSGFDFMAVKPHASPCDHSYNYLLNLLLDENLKPLEKSKKEKAMHNLRAFSKNEPVFQSYHSKYDPDHRGFLPSGTVGIPPVNLGYLALAYDFALTHSFNVPKAHFFALIGDSEFREGSLMEAMPDFSERKIDNVTWIIDYNRQSLDGHRVIDKEIYGNDSDRIYKSAVANGWNCVELRHGSFRKKLFKKEDGLMFKSLLEKELSDFELQAIILSSDSIQIREKLLEKNKSLKKFLDSLTDRELDKALNDFGGHDFDEIIKCLVECKSTTKPTIVIAHTVKGFGLRSKATCSNHNSLPTLEEVDELKKAEGVKDIFETFKSNSKEAEYLQKRHKELLEDFKKLEQLKLKNKVKFKEIPDSLDINLKYAIYPHTQWMLGQLISKLTRIATGKATSSIEKNFIPLGKLLAIMSPDVGTSTNLNPSMDGKIYGNEVYDLETKLNVRDPKSPHLVPKIEDKNRFLRFEITEASTMSCVGSFGKLKEFIGAPIIPIMSVYDFFIKRALDQYFYNLYWDSNFILIGTPSGITLSPEGAQHGWKSDFQIPNQITWEPFFCLEMDWIFVDTLKRHVTNDNHDRTGILLRATTRGANQKDFLKYLKKQSRFKLKDEILSLEQDASYIHESKVSCKSDSTILDTIRCEVLKGGYNLINFKKYHSYDPEDNVVNLISMGSPTTEAIVASNKLAELGIYANLTVVTSPDLLLGNLGSENNFLHFRSLVESKSKIVTIHDGEPGLLDNAGSILGVKSKSLAVRKHSKCGTPKDIYTFHGLDSDNIVKTALEVLS